MRLRRLHLVLPCAIAFAGCPSSPGLLPVDDPYDDLSSGSVSGTRWNEGQFRVVVADGAAELMHDIRSAQASFTHRTRLVAIPPGGGQVTTFKADLTVTSASASGDAVARAAISLVFQPLANRVRRPLDLENALVVRVGLQRTAAGLVAVRSVFECLPGLPDCQVSQSVGTPGFGVNWPAGLTAYTGTRYTVGISVDPANKRFVLTLSGPSGDPSLSQVFDLSGLTTATAPFVPDLSAAGFKEAFLDVGVRGGTTGVGDGAVTAVFDDVQMGVDGAPASPFDDFGTGARFDPSRWNIGGVSAESTPAGVRLRLDQAGAPAAAALNLSRTSATALHADVTVEQEEAAGSGRLAAELRSSLYNDGTNGSGSAPDVNAPSSQVGDVVAIASMTGDEAWHAVIRCESAVCSRFTFVEAPTALGSVTLGTRHTLSVRWDAERHVVVFQLDGTRTAEFDPVAAGRPIARVARSPCKRIAVDAGAAGPAEPFTVGSEGSLTATFANVRTE
jgi:hypothetical protein